MTIPGTSRSSSSVADGVHGYFKAYGTAGLELVLQYTFSGKGRKTPFFVRFSTVAYSLKRRMFIACNGYCGSRIKERVEKAASMKNKKETGLLKTQMKR